MIAGDGRWLFSIEDRVITSRTIWGLVRLGFVAFADMGAVRAFDESRRGKLFADAGFGFRLGNIRMRENNVIQIAVAFPLVEGPDGGEYKIVVGNHLRF